METQGQNKRLTMLNPRTIFFVAAGILLILILFSFNLSFYGFTGKQLHNSQLIVSLLMIHSFWPFEDVPRFLRPNLLDVSLTVLICDTNGTNCYRRVICTFPNVIWYFTMVSVHLGKQQFPLATMQQLNMDLARKWSPLLCTSTRKVIFQCF